MPNMTRRDFVKATGALLVWLSAPPWARSLATTERPYTAAGPDVLRLEKWSLAMRQETLPVNTLSGWMEHLPGRLSWDAEATVDGKTASYLRGAMFADRPLRVEFTRPTGELYHGLASVEWMHTAYGDTGVLVGFRGRGGVTYTKGARDGHGEAG